MTITTQEQQTIIGLTVGLFNAAPGAQYLAELTDVYEANGNSLEALTNYILTTNAFNAQYAEAQNDEDVIAIAVETFGIEQDSEAFVEAFAFFADGLANGQSAAALLIEAANYLSGDVDPQFADIAAKFQNKVEVATYFSVERSDIEELDIANLQAVVADVTADEASVQVAIDQVNAEYPADDDSDFAELSDAVVALQDTQAARDEALTELATAALPSDATEQEVIDLANDIVAGNEDPAIVAEQSVADADAKLHTAQAELSGAQAVKSDNQLKAELDAAQAEVNNNPEALRLQNELAQADNRLEADREANGTDKALALSFAATILAYLDAGGTDVGTGFLRNTVAEIAVMTAESAPDEEWADYVAGMVRHGGFDLTVLKLSGANADLRQAVRNDAAEMDQRADLVVKYNSAKEDFEEDGGLGSAYAAAQTAIEDRNKLHTKIEDAEVALEEAQANLANIEPLEEAYNNAADTYVEMLAQFEFNNGNAVWLDTAGDSVAGTNAETDIYIFDANADYSDGSDGIGTEAITLTNFEAQDFLFLGTDFTRVNLEAGVAIDEARVGDADVLEVFFQQDGVNLNIYLEQFVGAGNQMSSGELVQITLNGVNMEDVSFADGILSVA